MSGFQRHFLSRHNCLQIELSKLHFIISNVNGLLNIIKDYNNENISFVIHGYTAVV